MKPSLVKHPPLKHLVICIIENLEARLLLYRYCFLFTFFWPGCRKLLFLHVPRWLFYKIEVSFLKSFMWSGKGFPEGAFILYVLVTFFLKKQFSDNNLRSWTITYSCFFFPPAEIPIIPFPVIPFSLPCLAMEDHGWSSSSISLNRLSSLWILFLNSSDKNLARTRGTSFPWLLLVHLVLPHPISSFWLLLVFRTEDVKEFSEAISWFFVITAHVGR